MLSKLKSLTKFRSSVKDEVALKLGNLQSDLSGGLFSIMEKSFSERSLDKQNSQLSEHEIKKIIDSYANKNMIIAATTSIIPGPFGILGSVPELLLNFKNQMHMIYDLGCASGKENFINKDLLLDIPMAAFGGNTDLSALQNNGGDLTDSVSNILVTKAQSLGKSVVQQTLQKSIVQFIPVAGPVLMGTWSKMATRKISNISIDFLDDKKTYTENVTPEETTESKRLIQIEKIKGLANLIESNNEINSSQIELIGTIIENSVLTDTEKETYLQEALKTGSKFTLDKSLLQTYEEHENLLMEMVVMAKRSGQVDEHERAYVHEVGQYLGIEDSFVSELL